MNLSLNWLSEHLDLSSYSIEQLSDLLTFAGVEVEGIERKGVPSDLIVVAQIKEAVQHPDADKLKVCQIDAGEGSLRQIVCGAKNYKVGDKVPCALPGADLGGGFVINEGKLRGVESKGMLCGAGEIGLIDQEDGLLILAPELEIGTPLTSLFTGDTILELEITPNRPDCLSHFGMARELGAILNQTPKFAYEYDQISPLPSSSIKVEDTAACPYYTATKISGVTVADSPEWLVQKLEAIGLSPINNIVDITNFVLHLLGQPLHAFDSSKVGETITVRPAAAGEKLKGLDEVEYTLFEDDCVISDETGSTLALAGVLGGINSGVTNETSEITLEAAYFTPSRIRKTARRQGNMTTDSSYRFERGINFENVTNATSLAISLILEIAGGTVSQKTEFVGTLPESLPSIELSERLLKQITQGEISIETAEKHLSALGLEKAQGAHWNIPAYRQDLTRPIDLMEEVVRLEGFESLSSSTRSLAVLPSKVDHAYDGQLAIKRQLVGQGFYECNTIKLISEKSLSAALTVKPLLDGDLIKVALPLSEDHSTLRPSLTPGLIASAARNARQNAKQFRFFEIGKIFRNAGGGKAKDLETEHLGILMGGQRTPKSWNTTEEKMNAFDLKGIIQTLVPNASLQLKPKDRAGFLLAGDILINGKNVGAFAQLHPKEQRELDFSEPIYLAELEVAKIIAIRNTARKAKALPQFPGSSRDVALEAPLSVTAADIEAVINKHNEQLLVDFTCFDLFHDASGERLSAEKKSIAYRMEYRNDQKTLKAKEVDTAHGNLLTTLCQKLDLTQR